MSKEKYLRDLEEIKDIMNRSSKFISLSGMSGISAGLIAMAGAYAAYKMVLEDQAVLAYQNLSYTNADIRTLLIIAGLTLSIALLAIIYFTTRETKKQNQKVWDVQTKRLLVNLAIPLLTGGMVCIIMLVKDYLGLLVPMSLIFYGLSLVNASKYTIKETRSLGIIQIILGLIGLYFIEFSLIFWVVGFGALHIIYGIAMQLKKKS